MEISPNIFNSSKNNLDLFALVNTHLSDFKNKNDFLEEINKTYDKIIPMLVSFGASNIEKGQALSYVSFSISKKQLKKLSKTDIPEISCIIMNQNIKSL